MPFIEGGTHMRAASAAAAALWLGVALAAAQAAEDKTYTMKITLPTLNDSLHQFAKDYAAAVTKDSGGRIKAEVYPASQLGSIPRQIEGVQFGAIQCAIVPPPRITAATFTASAISSGLIPLSVHADA